MQLRLPRPKDAPPRRKRAPIVSTSDSLPCGICNQQLSRYTCPSCNLPYCSLACFKAPAHERCSEAFARGTLAAEVGGAPKEEGEDGERRMMEMLRQFEEQQRELEKIQRGEEEDGEEEDDDTEEGQARRKEREELEKRLAGLNLDSLSPEDLLALLSPSQQAAFQSTLQDPTRVTKLVEEQFEGEEPWWIVEEERRVLREMREGARRAAREGKGEEEDGEEESDEEDEDEEDVRPEMVDEGKLPPLKVGPDGKAVANPQLVFNVVAALTRTGADALSP
ncbi:hypothetical protein JCM6882_007785 [Rhodosporidiobolus microsporus]